MKIYAHYASQPARSVLWLLKMHSCPFEFVKVEPLAGGTKKADFLAKFPTALIPAMEDEGFFLTESSAILQYICEKHNLNDWWPTKPEDLKARAKVSEYLSYHHNSTRRISATVAFPVFQQTFFKKPWDPVEKARGIQKAEEIITNFERIFLRSENVYINGFKTPTIADLLAYSEIGQLHQLKIMNVNKDKNPRLSSWISRIEKLPFHDDIHQTVTKIGTMYGGSTVNT